MGRFKVDQNLPVEIAVALRDAGHGAHTVYDEELAGTPDPELGVVIQRERRGLVTLDLGFGDIRNYPPRDYQGIIVLRPSSQDKATVLHLFFMKTTSVTIRLDPKLQRELTRLSRQLDRSRSDFIRDAVRRPMALVRFEKIRRELLPLAEAKGILTDEDVFAIVS